MNSGLPEPAREDVVARLTPLAEGPHEIARVVDQLLHRGWLSTDDRQRLHLTEDGEAARARLRQLVTEQRAVVHQGIGDEEYVAALKVLRTMVANVRGRGAPGPLTGLLTAPPAAGRDRGGFSWCR